VDIADQVYSSGYRENFDYSQAMVNLEYLAVGVTLIGTLEVHNLKPNFAYQLKLVGTPNTDGNERIGLAGRWWEQEWMGTEWTVGRNLNDKGDGSSPNPNDGVYFERCDEEDATSPTGYHYSYTGYLVFAYFITDSNGDATVEFETGGSYHVLWKTIQRTPADDGSIETSTFDPDGTEPAYDVNYPSQTISIFGEWERLPVGGVDLAPGDYDCRMVLTEESFHGTAPLEGNWAEAMAADISFIIVD
jgi:hypothetical protein